MHSGRHRADGGQEGELLAAQPAGAPDGVRRVTAADVVPEEALYPAARLIIVWFGLLSVRYEQTQRLRGTQNSISVP
jgi:hypothetical protein